MNEQPPEDVEHRIVHWAFDKQIIQGGTRIGQIHKSIEEAGEAMGAVLKNRSQDAILDGIGDTGVTLIIQAAMNDRTMDDCRSEWEKSGGKFEIRTGKPSDSVGDAIPPISMIRQRIIHDFDEDADSPEPPDDIGALIYEAMLCLADAANKCGLSMSQCLEHAYAEIAGRSGDMKDGVFVKEEAH